MPTDFISLFTAALVAAAAPIIAKLVPRGLVPETVILLLAGALLGPYTAGVIELTDSIDMLSELGLAFLFLLAGYEIDPKSLSGTQGRKGLHLDRQHGDRTCPGTVVAKPLRKPHRRGSPSPSR